MSLCIHIFLLSGLGYLSVDINLNLYETVILIFGIKTLIDCADLGKKKQKFGKYVLFKGIGFFYYKIFSDIYEKRCL